MRALTAIVAAILSVTTGGPLRCPCQLADLLRPAAPAAVCDNAPVCRSCPCHRHAEPDDPQPRSPDRVPERVPCPHGPALDITPPPAGEYGVGNDTPSDEGIAFCEDVAVRVAVIGDATPTALKLAQTPPVDHIRYSHAFRC
ncbi:hypothetical protein [Urbifossiella limnaea]|uniref:Uncharacterized protein n=1 Tax=Urbifossiella limnaea TaxID=2528023 RepID=A0A517XV42_9BACT|nr:hypothetical protein [Urbifossiella limnaea]QDU21349.1 hypothetical protein ETAA1_33160 [Urbifossiella limnaea]